MIKEFPVTELYEVAEGKSPAELQEAVKALQKKGYKPEGGIVVNGKVYVQAMVQR